MSLNFNLELLYNLNDNLLSDNICPITGEDQISLLHRKNKIRQKKRYNIDDDIWHSGINDLHKNIKYQDYNNKSKADVKICGHFCSINGDISTINVMHKFHKDKIYDLLNIENHIDFREILERLDVSNFSIGQKQNKAKMLRFLNNKLLPSLFVKQITELYIIVLGRNYQGYIGDTPVFIENHHHDDFFANSNEKESGKVENLVFDEMDSYPDLLGMIDDEKIIYESTHNNCVSEEAAFTNIIRNITNITNYNLKIKFNRIFINGSNHNLAKLSSIIEPIAKKLTQNRQLWLHIQNSSK